jgi:aminopeptidase N
MKTETPRTVRLAEYQPPAYLVDTIDLKFELMEDFTTVTSLAKYRRQKSLGPAPLILEGEKMELLSVAVDGRTLTDKDFTLTDHNLTIPDLPAEFSLQIVTKFNPKENLTLEGLYRSKNMFCTQCEAQGFRRITYFPDRPDVMALFSTTIEADGTKFPILLSNGNLVSQESLKDGRKRVRWQDPFRKPSYLFALVAGDLGVVKDHFITRSGRKVALEIYVDKGNEDRTAHAMESLKRSMKWDEETYGLEYDLDIFMIVAVHDFNFGAMENKGLNIFNAGLLLAKPETATDNDYEAIEAVVAHEYFHNWTGNRVTCRDWFQLSLKEGLTVYRDQEFSADMLSRAVCRIENVNGLRQSQFPEDAGPMAHPIRPDSYIEINNFYTTTVYEKGAEVIRMLATFLGKEGFRKGINKYFELYDGQAVTTDDFIRAMEVANHRDFSQFRESWYRQAGTPELKVKGEWLEQKGEYVLSVKQSCAATPGQPSKKPFHLPLSMGLLDRASGEEVHQQILEVKSEAQEFRFSVKNDVVPSLLREFSAPVKLNFDYSPEELLFLMEKDTDAFVRWESGQKVLFGLLDRAVVSEKSGVPLGSDDGFSLVLGKLMGNESLDPAFRALLLQVPNEVYLGQQQKEISLEANHRACRWLKKIIADNNRSGFHDLFNKLNKGQPYRYGAREIGERSLKAQALSFSVLGGEEWARKGALSLLLSKNHMTDQIMALGALNHASCEERTEAMETFFQWWKSEPLVLNKWFAMQATSTVPGALNRVQEITKQPYFNINNPNNVYSLLGPFARNNPMAFHDLGGAAYVWWADTILDIDTRNPSLAARLAGIWNSWKRYDSARRDLIRIQLERILRKEGLSGGVYEIVSKALA